MENGGSPILDKMLSSMLKAWLFMLPWHTIWIYQESFLGNDKLEYSTLGFYATELFWWIIVVLFVVWMAGRWRLHQKDEKKFHWSSDRTFTLMCLLFLIYTTFSSLWAYDYFLASQHAVRIVASFTVFFVLLINQIRTSAVLKWFVAGSVLPSVLAIIQFCFQATWASKWLGLTAHPVWQAGSSVVVGTGERWLRAYGSFNHPNVLAGYLVLVISLLLFFQWRRQSQKSNAWIFLLLAILLTALAVSFGRAAWLALIVLIIITLVCNWSFLGIRKQLLFILIFFSILLLVLFPLSKVRLFITSSHEALSVIERQVGITQATKLFEDNKALGVGAGNYTIANFNFDQGHPAWYYQPVHNVPLLLLVELGIIGCVFLLFIFLSIVLLQIKINKTDPGSLKIWMMSILAFVIYLILASFDHYLFSSYIGLMTSGIYWAVVWRIHAQLLHN